jgi:hypothetical protein
MSLLSSWFKKIASKARRHISDLDQLPSYDDSERSQVEYFFKQQSQMRISAKSVPQWLWTPEQCRVWLFFIHDYLPQLLSSRCRSYGHEI